MKFLASLIALIFITFLSTPTLISLIDKEVDTSYFYSLCEEEESQVCFDEIKSDNSELNCIIGFKYNFIVFV